MAVLVHHLLPPDAELGLECGMGVVDSGVDDFGVAGGCARSEGGLAFEEEDFGVLVVVVVVGHGHGECAGGGEADDSSADDAGLDMVCGCGCDCGCRDGHFFMCG